MDWLGRAMPAPGRKFAFHHRHCEPKAKQSTHKHGVSLYGERPTKKRVSLYGERQAVACAD
jgi:hypothetical protein